MAMISISKRGLCVAALLSISVAISMAQSVTITSFGTPGGAPHYITAGPDGALWFTETVANKIGRITMAGIVTEYAIPTAMPAGCASCGSYGITAGSDGAVWFTEFGANKIGRITSAGIVTEYPIPTPISGPLGITLGPDGALWFTENAGGTGSKIGRITTSGVINEYPLPTPSSGPHGIAAGPDGALWFVEYTASRIGRITVSGKITEYALPQTLYNSTDITVGPDGALWFNQFGGNIGRITTTGEISTYSLHLPSFAETCGIGAGPDGAVWFTECGEDPVHQISYAGIGRITMAGSAGIYPLASGGPGYGLTLGPYGITLGPDGSLWFIGDHIWRAGLTFPTPTIAAVRNSADEYIQTIQSNSWVTVYGFNLAPAGSGRTWGPQDIVNGKLPLNLDGVSVTINGKPAPVEYVSSSQINVLAPADAALGPVNVIATNVNAASAPFSVQIQTYSPAFFTFSPPNQRYVAAVFPPDSDGSTAYVAPTGALGSGTISRSAKAGDILELYATGFGPTNPTPPAGQVFFGAYPTATPVTVMIGGANATVLWAGLTGAGLYQLNVTVPAGLPNGDVSVVASIGAVQTLGAVVIPVQQ